MNKPVQFASVIGAAATSGPQSPPSPWQQHGPFISYPDGVVVGNPVGGNAGDGSINAEALLVNGEPVSLGGDFVAIAGDGMTGPLILSATPLPTDPPLQAATKEYVDLYSGGGGGGIQEAPIDGRVYGRQYADWTAIVAGTAITPAPPTAPVPGQLWFDPAGLQLYVYYDDGTSRQWVVAINQVATLTAIAGLNRKLTAAVSGLNKRLAELEGSHHG